MPIRIQELDLLCISTIEVESSQPLCVNRPHFCGITFQPADTHPVKMDESRFLRIVCESGSGVDPYHKDSARTIDYQISACCCLGPKGSYLPDKTLSVPGEDITATVICSW